MWQRQEQVESENKDACGFTLLPTPLKTASLYNCPLVVSKLFFSTAVDVCQVTSLNHLTACGNEIKTETMGVA